MIKRVDSTFDLYFLFHETFECKPKFEAVSKVQCSPKLEPKLYSHSCRHRQVHNCRHKKAPALEFFLKI